MDEYVLTLTSGGGIVSFVFFIFWISERKGDLRVNTVSIHRPVDADTVRLIKEAFSHAWAEDTSSDPTRWTPENSTWGHADVAAITAQTIMCGDILVYDLSRTPFACLERHYRNRLIDGTIVGFSDAQFKSLALSLPEPALVHSSELLGRGRVEWGGKSWEEIERNMRALDATRRRFDLFCKRVFQALSGFDVARDNNS